MDRALRDAEAMVEGGLRSIIIENLGDAPFARDHTDPHVPAMLAVIGARIREELGPDLSLGINILRNDLRSALGAAAACGARFVRANVLISATWTDQGLIEGRAHELLRYRRELGLAPDQGPGLLIAADVLVKHGVPAGSADLEELAAETAWRGGADLLIATGRHTGGPTDLERVRRMKAAVPDRPVWVGSGVTARSAAQVREVADGAIVGTELHRGGRLDQPVEVARVRDLLGAAGS
jgi:membrane complex biogenesis BtpA family protein